MRIEIICTGDEVLTGKIVNTNFSYMSQKLEDVGLSVHWGTTVGDDRESLLAAFRLASQRADAVIVNGGLGPTVDDLSQEVAAQAAGVDLVLNEEWLATMEAFFTKRSRIMPPNNRKQAMLPATAEVIDNPVGTACGFALDIGRARFFFTPGVPRELRRMLEEQVIPRLLARSGAPATIHLKRFHSYGLGESHVDALLTGVEDAGARRQRETWLPRALSAARDQAHRARHRHGRCAAEARTGAGGGAQAARQLHHGRGRPDAGRRRAGRTDARRRRRSRWSRHSPAARSPRASATCLARSTCCAPASPFAIARYCTRRLIFRGMPLAGELTQEITEAVAHAARAHTGATHALVVLIDLDEGPDRIDFGGTIWIAIATAEEVAFRRSRILGGREWLRLGAVELGLDCLRRYLQRLPVVERIDFERT